MSVKARPGSTDRPVNAGLPRPTPVAVTEQKTDTYLALDPTADWTDPSATVWSWRPTPENTDLPAGAYGLPDDMRLRTRGNGVGSYVMVTDSYGLLAAITYPGSPRVAWAVGVPRSSNPHGIELLPDDNVAAAASDGGWVRLYTASRGGSCDTYIQVDLPGAHEVLWDHVHRLLWAVGDRRLVAYTVEGTASAPRLNAQASYPLPSESGHDLQPIPRDPDRLWVSTVYGVYQFQISTGTFDATYPRADQLNRTNVKSVGIDPRSGAILETTPKRGNPCSWCTDQVDLYCNAATTTAQLLTIDGTPAQIYRARWFIDDRPVEPAA